MSVSACARLTEIVVFPTPPFWLSTPMIMPVPFLQNVVNALYRFCRNHQPDMEQGAISSPSSIATSGPAPCAPQCDTIRAGEESDRYAVAGSVLRLAPRALSV